MNISHKNMERRALNMLEVWVLIAVSEEPSHIYGLTGRIYGASMSYVIPNRGSLRSVLRKLLKDGFVEESGFESGKRSRYDRKMYGITELGLAELRGQRTGLMLAMQAIDRASARRLVAVGV